jgi:hypothetical protein
MTVTMERGEEREGDRKSNDEGREKRKNREGISIG